MILAVAGLPLLLSQAGIEINPNFPRNPAYTDWFNVDFLQEKIYPNYDLVIGNPPYGKSAEGKTDKKMAEKFVRKGMDCLEPGGYLMYLMLLNFATSIGRTRGLFKDYPLYDVVPCVQRPSFKPGKDHKTGKERKNGTDQREYAIFIFKKGNTTSFLRFLDWKPNDRNPKASQPAVELHTSGDIR